MTQAEPEWDETERAWMFALAAWRDSRCTQCGGDLAETTADENDGSPGHARYVALDAIRCHRCTALALSEQRYASNKDTLVPHALMHRVELVQPRRRTT